MVRAIAILSSEAGIDSNHVFCFVECIFHKFLMGFLMKLCGIHLALKSFLKVLCWSAWTVLLSC